MKNRQSLILFCSAFLWATPFMPAQQVRLPTPDEVQRITAAMPTKPIAPPVRARKILVVGQNASHAPVPFAATALQIMGEKTGAFEAVVTEDGSMFEPEKLQQFDAVVINNWHGFNPFLQVTAAEFLKLPDAWKTAMRRRETTLRQSLLEFVAGGKGVVGLHAATVGLDDWKEYSDMIGGKYAALPWTNAILQVEEPAHPLCAGFHGRYFSIADEIYELKSPYSRDHVRVLLSVDSFQTTAPKSSQYGKPVRTDNDYGLSWVKTHGKGRVFYCALGHFSETYWNPIMLRHFLAGLQFALGDLPADATPTAKLKQPDGRRRGPIEPDANGVLRLLAKDVTLHGNTVRYEPEPHKNTVGYWTDARDWVSWTFQINRPGAFSLELDQASGQGSGSSEYAVNIGEKSFWDIAPDTGSFTNFVRRTLGEVSFAKPGRYTVSVKPIRKRGLAVMDLREITLKPKVK